MLQCLFSLYSRGDSELKQKARGHSAPEASAGTQAGTRELGAK